MTPTRGAVNSNVVVGLDDSFDFTSFLAAGNRITLSLDTDNTAAVNLVTFEAVVDAANGGTLDFVVPAHPHWLRGFVGHRRHRVGVDPAELRSRVASQA